MTTYIWAITFIDRNWLFNLYLYLFFELFVFEFLQCCFLIIFAKDSHLVILFAIANSLIFAFTVVSKGLKGHDASLLELSVFLLIFHVEEMEWFI